jgi:hypothetical protein
MHRVLRFSALLSLLIGAVLFLGACGGGSPGTTGSTASASASSAPVTTASAGTTAASSTTPTSAAAGGEVGTQGNPIPLGTEAVIGNWKVKVVSTDFNADAAVKDAPAYQAPDPGSQYVLVTLDAAYTGETPDSFGNGVGYQIVGKNGDTFNSVDLALDNSIENSNALVKDGSVSGSLVFAVPSDQTDGVTLWMAPSSAQEQTGTYFALK